VLGGQREIRLTTGPPSAQADIEWGSVMGARYPLHARCRLPEPTGAERIPGTAALSEAIEAHRGAVAAAVAHAAAREACRIVDAEVTDTRRRLRALTDRWVPRLDAATHSLNERLEENERAETTRIRWAASHDEREGAAR
jgi:V/A-type H+-transporting ATPase subunit D